MNTLEFTQLLKMLGVLALVFSAIILASKYIFSPSTEIKEIASQVLQDYLVAQSRGAKPSELRQIVYTHICKINENDDEITDAELEQITDEVVLYLENL